MASSRAEETCFEKCKQETKEKCILSIFRKSHITALEFHDEYLLIGEGHSFEIYNTKDLLCIQQVQIFPDCSIHGIAIGQSSPMNYVAIYGAKSLVIAQFSSEEKRIKSFSTIHHLEDWIWDVRWLNSDKQAKLLVAIALAHNSVVLWDCENGTILLKAECNIKCILYCGRLIGQCLKNLVFAAGTVFKEVVLWTPSDLNNENKKLKPIHTLQGHEGVIFSITFNRKLCMLSTTSDDRVVRIWKFSHPAVNINNHTETDLTIKEWKTGKFVLLHSIYGHEARVWTSALLPNCILSVGEDSAMCVWNYESKLIKREKCHNEGSIWSLAVNQSSTLAATGGSDGGLILWDVQELVSGSNSVLLHFPQEDDKKDFPRNITLLILSGSPVIFVATNEGALLSYSMQYESWKLVLKDKEFYSYNILACSPCRKFLIFGNITGKIYLLHFSDTCEVISKTKYCVHIGKIHNILWIDKESNFILSCGPHGKMILWKLNEKFCIEKQKDFILPHSKQRWMSAALLVDLEYLVIGDREGSLYLYKLNYDENPSRTFKHLHGRNGITDIKQNQQLIYSSGRDGRVLIFRLSNKNLQQLYSVKITADLEWIGKLYFVDDDLILTGFRTTNFIVWSSVLKRPIMEICCGGGHRSWDFGFSNNYDCTFVCIKKHDILYGKKNVYNIMKNSVIKKSLWAHELWCVHFLCFLDNEKETEAVFATGGEDNSLLLLRFSYKNVKVQPHLELLHSLQGHVSSIRAITSLRIEKMVNRHLLISVGGRAQLLIWEIMVVDDNLTCKELARNQLGLVGELHKKPWKEKNLTALPNPQTRYLDVCIWKRHNGDLYNIGVACSDATLRFFSFCLHSCQLQLCQTVVHGANCILRISIISEYKNTMILTGSTNGVIKVFSTKYLSQEENKTKRIIMPKPIFEKQLHQCGVNALCLVNISDSIWILFTGGDDGSLNCSVLILNDLATNIVTFTYPSTHYAQITGISALSKCRLLTTSVDQRLHLWFWKFNQVTNDIHLQITSSAVSCIPDITWLDVRKRKNDWLAVVCGQGVEAFLIQ